MSVGFQVLDWKPKQVGKLIGFLKVQTQSGMIVNDVSILQGDNGPWASPPSKPMIGSDGMVKKDDAGKTRYSPVIEFASKEIRTKFSDAVIAALRASHPGVLS